MRTAEQLGVPALLSQALSMWLNLGFLYGVGVDNVALETALQGQDTQGTAYVSTRADATAAVLAAWTGRLVEGRAGMRAVQPYAPSGVARPT